MNFPIELIPARARDAILAQAAIGNYPIESVGTAALAIMSHAAQGLYNVDSLQRPGVTYPLSQLFMILSPSGDAKSSIYKALMAGVHRWQARMGELYKDEMLEFAVDLRHYERQKAAVEKDKEATREDRLNVERSKPLLPRDPRNTSSKTTTNGIFSTLQRSYPTYGLFTGEGGSMLAGHSLRKENSPAEFASALTTLWDGDAVDRTTGDITMHLPGRRLSGLIMVQPEVAAAFLNDPLLKIHGIHAHFCIVQPAFWEPLDLDFTDEAEQSRRNKLVHRLAGFNDRIEAMLNEPMTTSDRDYRELTPPTIGWSEAARAHMRNFQTRALELRGEEETFFKRTFEHACRMAGVLAVFEGRRIASPATRLPLDMDNPVNIEISVEDAIAATALVEYYASEWRKLDVGVIDERDTRLAGYIERVVKFLRAREVPATMRDLSRNPLQRVDLKVREQVIDQMMR
ncbi:DUF3987 domain-containing protein, partial [Sphingobium yanoikuyae]|uniref:DUF3987 domain-containing protein n=1 Tax=Sphingobium yanoikuyae TaxID=13690 RepID=UPI001376B44E